MTTGAKRYKPRRRFHAEDVERLHAALAAGQQNHQPSSSSMGMVGLLKALRDDIASLRRSGYTIDVIATMLIEGGFDHLAPSTLRRYISETTARKRRRKRSVPPQPIRPSAPAQQAPSNPKQSSSGTPSRSGEFSVTPDRENL